MVYSWATDTDPPTPPAVERATLKTVSTVLLAIALACILPAVASAQDAVPPKAGPLLERALLDPAATMEREDGTFVVWVHLAGRELAGTALDAALDQRRRELPVRTLERRAKMIAPGEPLVDARDLPVSPVHRAAVEATGAEVRHESRWLNAQIGRAHV